MKSKKKSVVIIEKLPADARRNLAKLERRAKPTLLLPRRTAKVNPTLRRLHMEDPLAKKIISIYKDEGADAVLGLHKRFKISKRQILVLLAGYERIEGEA
jgi:hypothetical protein